MSEQTNTGRPKPEVRGKVIAVLPEWRNTTGTFWKQEIVVETGYRFPSPIKVTFQKEGTSHLEGIAEGDCVIIPYVLNGRQWDGPNCTQYYVDIIGMGLQKITGAAGGNGPATQAAKPVLGCTAATAIEEWAKKHGDDKAGFAEFCKALKPGKPSKQYTIADWADVVNAINKADEPAPADDGATDTDDLPF
ncbi:MAG: DUF3127 domain-containing protein [Kiritimatiellae bacterium]|nr:DUF3127 domain-containing protein [Kiritimatiellia bacterium]